MGSLNIVICGGGNGAHACVALIVHKGHSVRIFSPIRTEVELVRENYRCNQGQSFVIMDKEVNTVTLSTVTNDTVTAWGDVEVILVVVPAFAHKTIFRYIAKRMKPDVLGVVMPCCGLIELDIQRFLPNTTVMTLQTLLWACRLIIQRSHIDIKNIKTMTFSNIGQIFHPDIMYDQFRYDPHREFTESDIPLFYQGVSSEGAQILQILADEIHTIMLRLYEIDGRIKPQKVLPSIAWLSESYGEQIEDSSCMQTMLNSNLANQGIKVPAII